MIAELENQSEFYYTDELFKKYFLERKLTENEQQKKEELFQLINNFINKVYSEELSFQEFISTGYVSVSYLNDFGYYIVSDRDRGHYEVINYGEDTFIAFQKIITEFLFSHSFNYEMNNREQLKHDYKIRFNKEYNQCLSFTEYCLNKWNIYFDNNIPNEIINYYEKYLNSVNYEQPDKIWIYNIETKSFNLKTKDIVMKLKC